MCNHTNRDGGIRENSRRRERSKKATGGLTPVSGHCGVVAIPLIVCHRPSMCLFSSVFEPSRRLQRCVKNVRWWPMAMGGSGHERWLGFQAIWTQDLGYGGINQSCRCHRRAGEQESRRAGGRACHGRAQPGGRCSIPLGATTWRLEVSNRDLNTQREWQPLGRAK